MTVAAYENGGRACVIGYAPSALGPLPFSAASSNLNRALNIAEKKVDKQLIERAAEDLVVRSRARDQNAIAILTLIGQRAARGVPRAVASLQAVQAYVASHPYRPSFFGSDTAAERPHPSAELVRAAMTHLTARDPARRTAAEVFLPELCRANQDAAVIVLWRGAMIDSARLKQLMSALEPADRKAFARGARRPDRAKSGAELYGAAVVKARRIQRFSDPRAKASVLGSDIGWELD